MRFRVVSAAASAVLVACMVSGCSVFNPGPPETQDREIGDVTAVELGPSGDLVITLGETPSLTVTAGANIIDDLTSDTEGGVLRLGAEWRLGVTGPIRYELTVPVLEAATISGSGDVDADFSAADAVEIAIHGSGDIDAEGIDAESVSIRIDGSGEVTATDMVADAVTVRIDGSGDATLSGEATGQSLEIHGAGDYDASELKSVDTSIVIDGSGDVEVFATETLTVDIDGSGSVRYAGDPDVDENISGAGDVMRAG